jgi:hypothetical protein
MIQNYGIECGGGTQPESMFSLGLSMLGISELTKYGLLKYSVPY